MTNRALYVERVVLSDTPAMADPPKRRLPVLNSGGDDAEPPRPPWHWVGFGAVLVFAAWLPLATLAECIKGRVTARFVGDVSDRAAAASAVLGLSPGDRARLTVVVIGLPIVALIAGATAGGFVVGRFGDGVRARHGAWSGAAAAAIAVALSMAMSGLDVGALVAVPISASASAFGTWWGLRRRASR